MKDQLLAYDYIISTSEQMVEICHPLAKIGISYFGYLKTFYNGAYLLLDNDLEFRKSFFNNITNQGSYLTKLHTLESMNYNNYNFLLLPTAIEQYDKRKDPIIHLSYDYNFWNILCVYKRNIDYIECYYFCSNHDDMLNYKLHLNNFPLIEHFIRYFNEKAAHLIDTKDSKKLTYFNQRFDFLNTKTNKIVSQAVAEFYNETQLQHQIIYGKNGQVRLSKRQTECLQHLSKGNTLKEIGKILSLSPRTIEFYLAKIKEKTGYSSRQEILTQFQKYS